MGKGSSGQTIGYRYYFSIHMGLGRGPINTLVEIQVGGLAAYIDPVDLSSSGKLIYIDAPDLFGGDSQEGGIQGPMYCYNGAADQELQPQLIGPKSKYYSGVLPAIADILGGDVPNFRGVTTFWFTGLVCSMSPYPKAWAFRVQRSTAGWFGGSCWYPAKAGIVLTDSLGNPIIAMNPAHILYEINTNPEWGRGMPTALIDENSWTYAANQLCAEGFGLCMAWFQTEVLADFISSVIDHIGAAMYVDRESGLMSLRLIRDDYDPDDLPLFTTDTGLLDITDDGSSAEETAYNEIIVQGTDPVTNDPIEIRVQNPASVQSQAEIISNTIQYPGLPTAGLVARVAMRELQMQQPLRRMSVVLDRRGWRIAPGMAFRVSFPARGINNLILRAGQCSDTSLSDGRITIIAVQDVFGLPDTAFVDPSPPIWVPPSSTPQPASEQQAYEMSYRDFFRLTTTAQQNEIAAGVSFAAILAKSPLNLITRGYQVLMSLVSETYTSLNPPISGFTACATLSGDIGYLDTTLTLVNDSGVPDFLSAFVPGMAILIDSEQIELISLDSTTLIGTIKRSVADTIPGQHLANALIWLVDDEMGSDGQEYAVGETVYMKALTKTSRGLLDPSLATEMSAIMNQRVWRPYPPGNVTVNGTSIYASTPPILDTEPTIAWAYRDRIGQEDMLVGFVDGNIGPEIGTTYTIRVYDATGTVLLNTYSLGLVNTWTYAAALQSADGAGSLVNMELESNRDGVSSYFTYKFAVSIISGWGTNWGNQWGTGHSYRYWRFVFANNPANTTGGKNVSIGEIAIDSGAGFVNPTGGVASATSTTSGNPASLAFDGSISTFWSSSDFAAAPYWVQYDFGKSVTIIRLRFYGRQDFLIQSPYSITVEGSKDGVTFTSVTLTGNLPPWTAGTPVVISV